MEQFKWYIVQVLSGNEKKFIDALNLKIEKDAKSEFFEEFFIPEEEVIVVRRGKKSREKKKIFPGYVLVRMKLNDDSWHLIRNIPKVTGILGDGNKPMALSEVEVNKIYKRIEDREHSLTSSNRFSPGDEVQIIEGPFESFSATVQNVDAKKELIAVNVSIFGRQTSLELRFDQVNKD